MTAKTATAPHTHEPVSSRDLGYSKCRHCGAEITRVEGRWWPVQRDDDATGVP